MHAHKLKVNVQPNHKVSFELPSDFPEGEAEVIVLAAHAASSARKAAAPAKAAQEFSGWLGSLLGELPAAPVLPAEVYERAAIYDDQAKWPPQS